MCEPMKIPVPSYGDACLQHQVSTVRRREEHPEGTKRSSQSQMAYSDPSQACSTLATEARKQQQLLQRSTINGSKGNKANGKKIEAEGLDCNADWCGGTSGRWWMRSVVQCPLCNFPISLIPYPPFKLRVEPDKPKPDVLVDGKYLAMQVIANPNYVAINRMLVQSDIEALDEYVRRCKLGPFRPGQAIALAYEAATATCPERRAKAQREREKMSASAYTQLGKLRRIQEGRMRQFSDGQEVDEFVKSENLGIRSETSSVSTSACSSYSVPVGSEQSYSSNSVEASPYQWQRYSL